MRRQLNNSLRAVREIFYDPFFWFLTLAGNFTILMGAVVFYFVEHDSNPRVITMMDSIWWTFSTATTVGYGDITPVTLGGRIVGIGMMLLGTCLFAVFTALFANTVLNAQVDKLRNKIKHLESDIVKIDGDEKELDVLLKRMKTLLSEFESEKSKH